MSTQVEWQTYLCNCCLSPCLNRSALMGRPPTAQTCWLTEVAWPSWWWASSWSPLCWFWHWPHTAGWPDISNWACASSHTAGPCTRTCRPPNIAAWAPAAAVGELEPMAAGRERSGCEMKIRRQWGMGGGWEGGKRPLDKEKEGIRTREQGVAWLRKYSGCKEQQCAYQSITTTWTSWKTRYINTDTWLYPVRATLQIDFIDQGIFWAGINPLHSLAISGTLTIS